MAGKKTSVNKLLEIARLIDHGLNNRAIARALCVSRNTVKKVRDGESTSVAPVVAPQLADWTQLVQWEGLQKENAKGVSLAVLWSEEVENGRVPVQYPAFWKQFDKRFPESKTSMHRVFQPGSRLEIDYSDGIDFFDPITGEVVSTQLFVGALCHSR